MGKASFPQQLQADVTWNPAVLKRSARQVLWVQEFISQNGEPSRLYGCLLTSSCLGETDVSL